MHRRRSVTCIGLVTALIIFGSYSPTPAGALPSTNLTVPPTASGSPNTPVPITGVTLNAMGEGVTIQLSVTNGTLTLGTSTDLDFISGAPSGTSSIAFTAGVSAAQAALSSLSFVPNQGYSGAAVLTYRSMEALGNGAFDPISGHFYQVRQDFGDPVTWSSAQSTATNSSYEGYEGYLATITSPQEQAFVADLLSPGHTRTWIGGSSDDNNPATEDYYWQWRTGPESGTTFWQGRFDPNGNVCDINGPECEPVNGEYNNWPSDQSQPSNELDNSEEPENWLSIVDSDGTWDDFYESGSVQSLGYVTSYLIEYGDMQNDPMSPPVDTESTTITISTTPPGIPQNLELDPGNGQIVVDWDAPESDGGEAIDVYLVEYSIDNGLNWTPRPTTALLTETITNLENGDPVQVRVSAHNILGNGSATSPETATPATTPGQPLNLQATVDDSKTEVSWDTPTSDGGSGITGYKVEISTDGGNNYTVVEPSTMSPLLIEELNNGDTYTIRVTAINVIGNGTTPATTTVMPGTEPDAPKNLTLESGDTQIEVEWTAPGLDGGRTIDNYLVEYSIDNGLNWSSRPTTTQLQDTITGLENGDPVQVRVSAHNSFGYGPTTSPETETPATIPTAVQNLQASVASQQTVVSWTAPSDDGGSAITGYLVEYSNDGTNFVTHLQNAAGSPVTITQLTNGTTYTVRVTPKNAVGGGTADTKTVVPGTVPSAPAAPQLTVGNAQLGIEWAAPNSGGHAIDNYVVEYSIDNGVNWVATTATSATSKTLTQLTNGTPVRVRVIAHNDIGYGEPSSYSTATPATTPSAPQNLATTSFVGKIELSWNVPASDGGAAITVYKVEYSSNGGNTYTTFIENASASPVQVTNLTNGTLYKLRVSAVNGIGAGTTATIDATAGTIPSAPVQLSASSKNRSALLTWGEPVKTGGLNITGYRVEYAIGNSTNWTVATSSATSPYTLADLTNGTGYSVRVSALNQIGPGPVATTTVTPYGPASVPQNVAVTHTTNAAVVTWTPPADDGGTPILSYTLEYRITNGEWVLASSDAISPSGMTGLTPGSAYEIRLAAVTELGTGTFATANFNTDVPPVPGVPAPIHLDTETGTITPVPVFDMTTISTTIDNPAPPVVASTPSGNGSWALTPDGGIFTAGDAGFFGSMGSEPLAAPAVGIAPTPTGNGYLIVGSDGGVFAFGDASFQGSMGGVPLNAPVTAIAPSCSDLGYYLVANDGGVFAFGVGFFGSMAGLPLNQGMIGIVDSCGRNGYWTFARDGGVFTFGDAEFYGSLGSNPPAGGVIAMVSAPDGRGYWLIGADNKAYGFGSVA